MDTSTNLNLVTSSNQEVPENRRIEMPLSNNHQRVEILLGRGATNTHFFDGKLSTSFLSLTDENISKDILEDISRAGRIDKDAKSKAFQKLEEKILSLQNNVREPRINNNTVTSGIGISATANAVRCLKIIVQTHDIHGRTASPGNQNYSSPDKLFACDLLYLLYEKIIKENSLEHLSLLLTQLDEMASGMCPMGRCNRLFQTYVMLRDDLTPTSK